MRDFTDDLCALRKRLDEARAYLKVDSARARLEDLEKEVALPNLWDDQDNAKAVNAEYARVRDDVQAFDALAQRLDDTDFLHDLAREEGDESQEGDIDA